MRCHHCVHPLRPGEPHCVLCVDACATSHAVCLLLHTPWISRMHATTRIRHFCTCKMLTSGPLFVILIGSLAGAQQHTNRPHGRRGVDQRQSRTSTQSNISDWPLCAHTRVGAIYFLHAEIENKALHRWQPRETRCRVEMIAAHLLPASTCGPDAK